MIPIREFLNLLFGAVAEGVLEITYLAPKELKIYPSVIVDWHPLPLALASNYGATIDRRNKAGYGTSFGCAVRHVAKAPVEKMGANGKPYTMTRRGEASDSHILTCFWADVDVKTTKDMSADDKAKAQADGLSRLQALNPNIIVASGGGYHGYWLLDTPHHIHEVDMPEIKWALKGIAKQCGGDEAVAELARIMRLPGTINTKPERAGFRAEVIYCDTTVRYAYTDLIGTYTKHGKPPEPPITRAVTGRISSIPSWVNDYLATGASTNRNNTLFRMACSCQGTGMSEGEAESLLLPRAIADGLSESEAKGVVKSAYSKGRTPILPRGDEWRKSMIIADDHIFEKRKKRGEV